ncbi:MAG: Rha family transcriptional regulator [Magnetococcales bacterium]|nr:Rha family transcriptional regulator [Magnetococcales bacterium]
MTTAQFWTVVRLLPAHAGVCGVAFETRPFKTRFLCTLDARPHLTLQNNQVVANSLDVAKAFGKQHKHILRDIQALEIPDEVRRSNFGPTQHPVETSTGGVRMDPSINMTRDGFTLLAMGFTGKRVHRGRGWNRFPPPA